MTKSPAEQTLEKGLEAVSILRDGKALFDRIVPIASVSPPLAVFVIQGLIESLVALREVVGGKGN